MLRNQDTDEKWQRGDEVVSQLSELQKDAMKRVSKKYSKLSIPEALENAKQRLTALTSCLSNTGRATGRRTQHMSQ